jgi:DNA-binding MarR family transcriptional regulator
MREQDRTVPGRHAVATMSERSAEATLLPYEADASPEDVHEYFEAIAEARYVVRKVFRIIDEQARQEGLEPLEHQALLQVYGGPDQMLHVNKLAERLDIVPAFASKLVKGLEALGLVERVQSKEDRRVIEVRITATGREKAQAIDADVQLHVDYFQKQLSARERRAALRIFSFYVGVREIPGSDT